MKIYIYLLKDPITNKIRYIGKTKNLKTRLSSHISYAKNKKRKSRKVSDWILKLSKNNLKPIIEVIEISNDKNWQKREIYWIKYYRNLNCDLCNLTDGGDGNNNYKYSKELKEVRRKARLGYKTPKYVKDKISKSLRKKIYCITDDIYYNSITEAAEILGVTKSTFHRKLHKKQLINNKIYKMV